MLQRHCSFRKSTLIQSKRKVSSNFPGKEQANLRDAHNMAVQSTGAHTRDSPLAPPSRFALLEVSSLSPRARGDQEAHRGCQSLGFVRRPRRWGCLELRRREHTYRFSLSFLPSCRSLSSSLLLAKQASQRRRLWTGELPRPQFPRDGVTLIRPRRRATSITRGGADLVDLTAATAPSLICGQPAQAAGEFEASSDRPPL